MQLGCNKTLKFTLKIKPKYNTMKRLRIHTLVVLATGVVFMITSCGRQKSSVTGWNYNDPSNGGFEVVPYEEQETGPGLILVQGGTFAMGRTEQDVTVEWNNIPRRVTVSSFYMDESE